MGAFGDRFTMTPELGLGLSPESRDWRVGWRLGLARSGAGSFDLGVEATRNEPAGGAAGLTHGIQTRLTVRW